MIQPNTPAALSEAALHALALVLMDVAERNPAPITETHSPRSLGPVLTFSASPEPQGVTQ